MPSYEGSNDTVISFVPVVRGRVSRINFSLRGTASRRTWCHRRRARLGCAVRPRRPGQFQSLGGDRRHAGQAAPKTKTAIEVGGYVGLGKQGVITSDYDKITVSVSYTHDILGANSSYTVLPSIDYGTPLSTKTFVGISFSGTYIGGGYADTYYGIRPAGSAASGLPVFAAGKGWKDWTVGTYGAIALTGDLTGGLSAFGAGSYRRLLGDAAASPVTSIAGSRDQWVAMLGLAYTF
ncbi:MAG: MipA/OmpV family protein [Sphingomonas sp.]